MDTKYAIWKNVSKSELETIKATNWGGGGIWFGSSMPCESCIKSSVFPEIETSLGRQ